MVATAVELPLVFLAPSRVVSWRGKHVLLSHRRWRLVAELARARGRLVDAPTLARRVVGSSGRAALANLRVVVRHARWLLPDLIETEPGFGYRLATERVEGL